MWLLIHALVSYNLAKEAFSRALFQYKDHLSRYDCIHYKDKTVMRLSYLYDRNPYTGKTNLKKKGIFFPYCSAAHRPLAMYLRSYKALHCPILVSARLDVFKYLLAQLPKFCISQCRLYKTTPQKPLAWLAVLLTMWCQAVGYLDPNLATRFRLKFFKSLENGMWKFRPQISPDKYCVKSQVFMS